MVISRGGRPIRPIPEAVKDNFKYDPETGLITRNSNGCVAGYVLEGGTPSRYINFRSIRYPAHRIAWFLMTGENPDGYVKFEDKNRFNLRWKNLYVTHTTNPKRAEAAVE